MPEFREQHYTAQDGLSLYYREYGDRDAPETPVLCLGGLTRNSKDFHSVAMRLHTGRRVICPDYRGRGRSAYDPNPQHYQPATYLNDIRHLFAAANVGPAIIIGTSLGGLLAMAMGAAMPSMLAGVVLNDVGPDIGGDGLSRILDYVGVDRPHSDWDSAVQDLRRMFPHLSLDTEEAWLEAAQATWREGADGMLHFDWDVKLVDMLRDGPPVPDLWPLFHSLGNIPILAIRGALSDVLTAATFDKMAMARADLVQITVPGAGHVPTLSEPSVREPIDTFIAGLSHQKNER
ncbi:MAG: alpha/beta fold hydrolase [Alphaproteobacteria bacterium]|nr:alpha/beta fold hydrolase [Alphaproteobacteria bacterium]